MARTPETPDLRSQITLTRAARIVEYKRRRQSYASVRIPRDELDEHLTDGWILDKELIRGIRVRKELPPHRMLSNKVWILLYLLGYDYINHSAPIFFPREEIDPTPTQIDILAMDDETAVVAVCVNEDSAGDPLEARIKSIDASKKHISNAIRAAGGSDYKPKIIWCIVTSRVRWKQSDVDLAKSLNIQIIKDQELRYFMEIAKTLGRAAKYQFHAEFLSGQKIPALSDEFIPASRFRLGGRNAYAFTISAKDLLRRSFVNHRDLRDPSGAPTYQRLVNASRIKKIASFLDAGGYFANSVLVNFHHDLRFDITDRDSDSEVRFGRLYLPDIYKTCWIIDGQHRIYGAAVVEDPNKAPAIPVVAFERLPAEEEANLFATINREQKQVQKKLLDELDGELKWGSPDPREAMNAIAARSLDMLRNEVLGPFEDRIALPGMRGRQQPLTVPQLKPAIIQSTLIGRISSRDGRFIPGPLTGANHEESLSNLCSFLSTIFDGVRQASPDRWTNPNVPLCHNVAVPALIRLSYDAAKFVEANDRIDINELSAADLADQVLLTFKPFIDFCRDATDEEFKARFPITFGAGGPRRYMLQVAALVREQNVKFTADGLEEFLANSSKDRTDQGDKSVKWISDSLHRYVVSVLRNHYGTDFFEKGIKNKDIKIKAYAKRADTDPDGETPLETYLDIIELKKIVETSENWPLFKSALDIQLPGQQKGLAKYIKWIDDFNDIRKIYAHPYNRSYSESDIGLLDRIESTLRTRLS
jgi:DNA sulfur modification protein DndB